MGLGMLASRALRSSSSRVLSANPRNAIINATLSTPELHKPEAAAGEAPPEVKRNPIAGVRVPFSNPDDVMKVFVDRHPIKGMTDLQAGVNIPRFCYHDRLSIAGNCRMFHVQVEKTDVSSAMPMPALSEHGSHEQVPKNKAETELVLDGGFSIPQTNSFGHNFRDYDVESERQSGVENFYHLNHINQTLDFVKKMRQEYAKLDKAEMSIWECCELLNEIVDESDPDIDEPQIVHLLQTAEAIRKDYPDQDWLHLTALIHDLGKVLAHPSFGELPQWAVVGDTFPVGCAFDESIVYHKYFLQNPDYNNPAYNTKYGIYSENCGLDNVMMSWGHDDYMNLVAKENGTTLPSAGLFVIRYHSFYALHKSGAYKHLMNEEDKKNLKWLQIFNKYDLYSKSKVRVDVGKVKPYYESLINKYFPAKLRW